jgi:hypothetical protein
MTSAHDRKDALVATWVNISRTPLKDASASLIANLENQTQAQNEQAE